MSAGIRCLAVGFLFGALAIARADVAIAQNTKLSAAEALQVVRRINTAQAGFAGKAGIYASLGDAVRGAGLQSQAGDVRTTTASLPGYTLTLVVAGDGRSYQLALIPAERCAVGLFSSEAGVIYEGRGLGC